MKTRDTASWRTYLRLIRSFSFSESSDPRLLLLLSLPSLRFLLKFIGLMACLIALPSFFRLFLLDLSFLVLSLPGLWHSSADFPPVLALSDPTLEARDENRSLVGESNTSDERVLLISWADGISRNPLEFELPIPVSLEFPFNNSREFTRSDVLELASKSVE